MSKHLKFNNSCIEGGNRVVADYNRWNYYLLLNKYPIVMYFNHYGDLNKIAHQLHLYMLSIGGESCKVSGGIYRGEEKWWHFITTGNVLALFFKDWEGFIQFIVAEMGKRVLDTFPFITLSAQGYHLNLLGKGGVSLMQIIEAYQGYINNLTLCAGYIASPIYLPICLHMWFYMIVWVITGVLLGIVQGVYVLVTMNNHLQEYRYTLLQSNHI